MPRCCTELVLASLLLVACASSQGYREQRTQNAGVNDLHEQLLDDRPKLVLIERSGDGATALAFAARTGEPPIANYGLSLIIQRRLAKAGIAAEANPNGFGLSFVTLVNNQEGAAAAISALRAALAQEIRASDFDRRFLDAITEQFGPGVFDTPGDIEIARCSGQLYRDARQSAALADGRTLVHWLEAARVRVFSQDDACFALAGSGGIAAAVRSRLLLLPAWPRHQTGPLQEQPKTPGNAISVSEAREWALSLAWSSGSFGEIVSAWRALRAPDSPLVAQLAMLESPWRVDAISAIAGPVGGCLRIDISDPDTHSSKSSAEVAQTVRLALNESRIALQHGEARDSADVPELFGSDPRLTARRAAWRALSVDRPGQRPSYQISLHAPEAHGSDLKKAVLKSLRDNGHPVEIRSKAEVGQPEEWMLLASPCGTAAESGQNSGATAAWLRTVARKYSGAQGVALEPWISEYGMGILAHSKVQHARAGREKLPTHLGDTLGRVAATAKISGQELAFTREELLVRVGVQPRRAWALLLDTVSARKPSLFEPLGSADSLRHLNVSDLILSRRRWIQEPLRAAFATSDAAPNPAALEAALARWLQPHRISANGCEELALGPSPERETPIVTYSSDELDASAYLAYDLQQTAGTTPGYDLWLEWLLNRPGGWLERWLVQPGFARGATAYVKGPRIRRMLFVEINSIDDAAATEAIKRVRAFLAEIAQTGPAAAETDLAFRWGQSRAMKAALDPRNRLVSLWLGEPPTSNASRAGFPSFLAKALESAPVTIMRVHK